MAVHGTGRESEVMVGFAVKELAPWAHDTLDRSYIEVRPFVSKGLLMLTLLPDKPEFPKLILHFYMKSKYDLVQIILSQ